MHNFSGPSEGSIAKQASYSLQLNNSWPRDSQNLVKTSHRENTTQKLYLSASYS